MKPLYLFQIFTILMSHVGVAKADSNLAKSWGVFQTQSTKAWRLQTGSKRIVVAVIDTGIDVSHPDLKHNIWVNPGESGFDEQGHDRASNGKDDDKNGYVDDVHGWNFVANNNDVSDRHGHGTHIAGIIGAVGGNGIGLSGVSPHVSLMALKYYDPDASESNNLGNTVRAIRYANKMKVHIINYSGGGFSRSLAEEGAIREADQNKILFVAAAGNEKSNSDQLKFYPANYELQNVIAVTAIDQNKKFLNSSNYGRRSVHLAAPGNEIYSTLPNRKYGIMTGTSQATAFVSGSAALLMASSPHIRNPRAIREALALSGQYNHTLVGKTEFSSTLNIFNALVMKSECHLALGERTISPTSRMLLSSHNPIPGLENFDKTILGARSPSGFTTNNPLPADYPTNLRISDVGDR